jgi:putative FmdB family regulatory protein
MPIYDYRCPTCGPFTAMQPMARYREPYACPACDIPSARTLLGAPALAGTDISQRGGPVSGGREGSGQRTPKAAHPAGCGCCVRRAPIPAALASKGRVFASSGPLPPSRR